MKTNQMNYRKKLESMGYQIKETYSMRKAKKRNVAFLISKNNKSYSYKTLKDAYELIDLF